MSLPTDESNSRAYYDEFSKNYEARRGGRIPHGYHELLDHLESDYVRKFGDGKEVLEVGCGTGLVLERVRAFARRAEGVDLSPGMLEKARERGLSVQLGSATNLPYEDNTFDVTCSFKVLAHIPGIEKALSEMARVTKPGGIILAEFYNPYSFRGLLRALGPVQRIGSSKKEDDVFTRFDSPSRAKALCPSGTTFVEARGIRILTPAARVIDSGLIGPGLFKLECLVSDSPLRFFAGFFVAAYRKQ